MIRPLLILALALQNSLPAPSKACNPMEVVRLSKEHLALEHPEPEPMGFSGTCKVVPYSSGLMGCEPTPGVKPTSEGREVCGDEYLSTTAIGTDLVLYPRHEPRTPKELRALADCVERREKREALEAAKAEKERKKAAESFEAFKAAVSRCEAK